MPEEFKEMLGAEPFVPFRIVLTSGTRCDMTSPYQVAIGKTQFDYYYPKSDHKALLRQNQVTAYEPLEPAGS
jgi:hypothetical protein